MVTACSQRPQRSDAAALQPQYGSALHDAGDELLLSKKTNAVYAASVIDNADAVAGGREDTDAQLSRYARSGGLLWKKTYYTLSHERIESLSEDATGNVLFALNSGSTSTFAGKSQAVKLAPSGKQLSQVTLTGVREVFALVPAKNGNLYVAAQGQDAGGYVRSYSADGRWLWSKKLSGLDVAKLAVDAKGNIYLLHYEANARWALRKFSSAGNLIWAKSIPLQGANFQYVTDLVLKGDALWITGEKGWVTSAPGGSYSDQTDIFVTRYLLDGTPRWTKVFGTSGQSDAALGVDIDANATAFAAYLPPRGYPLVVKKIAGSGALLGQSGVAAEAYKRFADFALYAGSELYFSGETTRNLGAGFKGGYSDAFLLRTDGQGRQVWVR